MTSKIPHAGGFNPEGAPISFGEPHDQLAIEIIQHVNSTPFYSGDVLRIALEKLGYRPKETEEYEDEWYKQAYSLDDRENREGKPSKP